MVFEGLSLLSREDNSQFQRVLQLLLHYLEIRFPSPSLSFDMKRKCFSDLQKGAQQIPLSSQRPNCSVLPLLNFMAFPHSLIYDNSLMTIIPDVLRAEVFRMAQEISTRKKQIVGVNRERMRTLSSEVGFVVFGPISLSDVFTVLKSEDNRML